jgi:hypothetical protein
MKSMYEHEELPTGILMKMCPKPGDLNNKPIQDENTKYAIEGKDGFYVCSSKLTELSEETDSEKKSE